MNLSDVSSGPDWIVWIGFAILAVLSIVLISGHGSWFIAGYNTASKEEKAKYDEKKLCRTTGIGLAVISILILVSELFEDVLPASFAYVSLGITIIDCLVIIIVGNTICKKRWIIVHRLKKRNLEKWLVTMEEYVEMCSQFGPQAGMTDEEMREYCKRLFPTLKRWKDS